MRTTNLSLTLSCGGTIEKRQWHRRRAAIDGVFECKTCNRRFPTFQALGGHRTSHTRTIFGPTLSAKAKVAVHECAVCGAGFALGQALGGHMRRHKAAATAKAVEGGEREEAKKVDLNVDSHFGDCDIGGSRKACLLKLFY